MGTNALKICLQTIKTTNSSYHFLLSKTLFPSFSVHTHHHHHHLRRDGGGHVYYSPPNLTNKLVTTLSVSCSLSSSSPSPPTSKDGAILQAKTCLSTTLEKPLNYPRLSGYKLKKLKQHRYGVEIPVVDESPQSLSQLALEVFGDLPSKRRSTPLKVLIIWPNITLTEAATKAFETKTHSTNTIDHVDISSVDRRILNSADVAVFLVPESTQLAAMKTVTDSLYPKPVVIFNPKWGFEEENEFGDLSSFVGSFEVIYSFMGLEVQGVLSKRKGLIFKCVRDGVLSGERWNVLVEEGGGELKVVSTFKSRPSIGEVETVLYNLMAMSSPITKSAKFLKDLVSNVTGKK